MTESDHEGRIYTLTGPEAVTHSEIAAAISDAIARPVTFVDVPPEAMREALLGMGMPAWQADGLIEDYAHYRCSEAAAVKPGVQEATGRRESSPPSCATTPPPSRDHACAIARDHVVLRSPPAAVVEP